MADSTTTQSENVLDWREFLTARPPGTRASVDRAAYEDRCHVQVVIKIPLLELPCSGSCQEVSYCNGTVRSTGKLFGGLDQAEFQANRPDVPDIKNMPKDAVIAFACERCGKVVKSYSLRFWKIASSSSEVEYADVHKISEWPPFLPRIPSKVMSLVGPDRELFLKGRRAEVEGLGIAAFAYYRRIVEDQKNRLLDEIIRVASHLGQPVDVVRKPEAAKQETQFSNAVESVRESIPDVLRIKTHNPLTLLHSALSKGLHSSSDEACLELAADIRIILVEFAERLSEVMMDQKELNDAVSRLVNRPN